MMNYYIIVPDDTMLLHNVSPLPKGSQVSKGVVTYCISLDLINDSFLHVDLQSSKRVYSSYGVCFNQEERVSV